MIELQQVRAGYLGCSIVHDINLVVNRGSFFALIGPNGSGKSTLLHTISGRIQPYAGHVLLDGIPISQLSRKQLAQHVAVLEQLHIDGQDLTVRERVALGRIPHQSGFFQSDTNDDHVIVKDEINKQRLTIYENQITNRLSGGEQQRVHLAKTFAQETSVILLDEPTNHLDFHHTIELLQSLKTMQKEQNLTIFAILHDVNLAARFADEIGIMDKGRLVRTGKPQACLDEEIMLEVFQIDTIQVIHPTLHCPQFIVK